MSPEIRSVVRVVVTLAIVTVALLVARSLWIEFKVEPWTRDGRVMSDVVLVTPDVSGLITDVYIHDNEFVRKGQSLFTIDHPRYVLAVAQAEASKQSLRVQLDQSRREDRRNDGLGELVATEEHERTHARVQELEAALAQASAALDVAKLNLERTEIRAAVTGVVTNLELHPGYYATAGHPEFSLIDLESMHVEGYFEETKIARIAVGDPVEVRLMGESKSLPGHVESIARGIEDRDRSTGARLLSNVSPTFNWVRLAQRIPVRVALDVNADDARLISGRTVTVTVLHGTSDARDAR